MFWKITSCVLLATLACCEPPVTGYPPPLSSYGTPNYNAHGDHYDHSEPKSYEFGYAVKDDYSGNNYNRQETSDGNQVRGEYRVALPDGRTQIVTYYADWQTGFHADVRYEGTAHFPEQNKGGYPAAASSPSHYSPPSTGYGTPSAGGYQSSGYATAPATSSVSIKDYSSDSTPYTTGSGSGYSSGYNNNDYSNSYDRSSSSQGYSHDSYAPSNDFGSRIRPSNQYGAP